MSHMIFRSVGDEAAFAIMAKQRAQAASGRKVPTINDYNSALRTCIAEKASDWQAACKSAEEASKEIGRLKAEIARLRLTDAEREAVDYFAVIHAVDGEPLCNHAATLRGLLERTK